MEREDSLPNANVTRSFITETSNRFLYRDLEGKQVASVLSALIHLHGKLPGNISTFLFLIFKILKWICTYFRYCYDL
jgi:hypothetical protein